MGQMQMVKDYNGVDDREVAWALLMIRVHTPLVFPAQVVCRNCQWPHPCATRRLAQRVLVDVDLVMLAFPDVVDGGQNKGAKRWLSAIFLCRLLA